MFDFFRNHMKVLQVLLFLLIFPSFVFFGIQGYSRFNGDGGDSVAQVAGVPITQAELDKVLGDRLDTMRRQNPNIDPKFFAGEQMRKIAIDSLISDRVLYVAADKLHFVAGDDRVKRVFATEEEFAQWRNPDGSLNRELVESSGMTPENFVQRLRQGMARRQVMVGLSQSALAPAAATSAALDAMYQQREVQVQQFDPKALADQVKPTDAEVEAYYKSHVTRFQAPEEAQIEYVVLDQESLKKAITLPDADVRKYYDENLARYSVPEERKVSQILVAVDKTAPQADRDKAKAKATRLAAEAKADPARFAELARKNSDDDATAKEGGQMEFFGHGSMLDLKPFEDAVFALKPGEISAPVESDFGYHVIQLNAVRGGDRKSFESVRSSIETELRNQLGQKRFTEAATDFGNLVYEQPDSLKPAADRWKLEIQKADHVTRFPDPQRTGALANANFLTALFSSDVVQAKHNTKAIDVGNQLAAGRVVKYTAAHPQPFDEVKAQVRAQVVSEQAAALAKKQGLARLAELRAAPAAAMAASAVTISRAQASDLPPPLVEAVLKAPVASLPAVVGTELPGGGYALARITKIVPRDAAKADAAQTRAQYAQVWGAAEERAYYETLKARYKVTINSRAASAAAEGGANEPR